MSSLLTGLYDRLPPALQTAGVTLYGLKIYLREYGARFRKELEAFERRQWSRAELEEYQNEQLSALVEHAFHNVPYYRDLMQSRGLRPVDVRTVADLPKLPILTADQIRRNFERLVARNVRRSALLHGHTSGTTGTPLQFLYDRNVCLIKNVVDWRQKRCAGVDPGDRMAFFLGRMIVPTVRTRPPFWRANRMMNHLFFSSFHMSAPNLESYFGKLAEFGPRAIEGYPSTLFILASYLLSRNTSFPVGAAFTSSETLFPAQREAIERAFECKVFDFYGLAERVAFATECETHQGHHLNSDFGITEILGGDGIPAAPGEMGRLVATGLHNFGMPLIRYQTSDVTCLRVAGCACGRAFPVMEDVTTKDEDIITTGDGRYVSSSVLTHPFKPLKSVLESQIVQEDLRTIRVKVVRRPEYTDDDTRYIVDELKKRVGHDMAIEVEFVESIPRTKAGKFRWVISKVPLKF